MLTPGDHVTAFAGDLVMPSGAQIGFPPLHIHHIHLHIQLLCPGAIYRTLIFENNDPFRLVGGANNQRYSRGCILAVRPSLQSNHASREQQGKSFQGKSYQSCEAEIEREGPLAEVEHIALSSSTNECCRCTFCNN